MNRYSANGLANTGVVQSRHIRAGEAEQCLEPFRSEVHNPRQFAALVEGVALLLERQSAIGVLFYGGVAPHVTYGLGLSWFVTEEAYARLLAARRCEIDDVLAGSSHPGSALMPAEVGRDNSGKGLHLVTAPALGEAGRAPANTFAVRHSMAQSFMRLHLGYRLKSFTTRLSHTDDLKQMIDSGAELVTSIDEAELSIGALPIPVLTNMERSGALKHPGSWMSMFFNYTPPRICFTESEQSMLALALTGASDRELTELLHVSIDTVKKRWEKIFERVSAMDPDVLPQGPVNRHARRGPEKRRHLLRYLNSHLEELRPYGTRPEKMLCPSDCVDRRAGRQT